MGKVASASIGKQAPAAPRGLTPVEWESSPYLDPIVSLTRESTFGTRLEKRQVRQLKYIYIYPVLRSWEMLITNTNRSPKPVFLLACSSARFSISCTQRAGNTLYESMMVVFLLYRYLFSTGNYTSTIKIFMFINERKRKKKIKKKSSSDLMLSYRDGLGGEQHTPKNKSETERERENEDEIEPKKLTKAFRIDIRNSAP
eukprot:gene7494-5280_t